MFIRVNYTTIYIINNVLFMFIYNIISSVFCFGYKDTTLIITKPFDRVGPITVFFDF